MSVRKTEIKYTSQSAHQKYQIPGSYKVETYSAHLGNEEDPNIRVSVEHIDEFCPFLVRSSSTNRDNLDPIERQDLIIQLFSDAKIELKTTAHIGYQRCK
jgi:hypothetical protein